MKRIFLIVLTAMLCVAARAQDDRAFEIAKNLEIFSNVYKQLNLNYVDDVDPGKTIKVAIILPCENYCVLLQSELNQ